MNLSSVEHKAFQFGDALVVLDIPRSKLFKLDRLSGHILRNLLSQPTSEDSVHTQLVEEYPPEEVLEALSELKALGLIYSGDRAPAAPKAPELPTVRTLCLNIIHRCNLRCTYCYATGGVYGTPGTLMSYSTAVQAVEFLLDQIGQGESARIHFFGGEPLLAWDLLQRTIPYIRRREKEEDKNLSLHLTTNGTLLTDDVISFLHRYDVRVAVSLDGPPHIHDSMRVFPNGTGSYQRILPNIEKLLDLQGACRLRATLDPNEPRLNEVVEHLLHVGATTVHAELASLAVGDGISELPQEGVEKLKREYGQLKQSCVQAIERGSRSLPFQPFETVIRHLLAEPGHLLFHGCQMGRDYLAVSPRGELYPCHRFIDHKLHCLGDLSTGPSVDGRMRYAALHVDGREPCRNCWARYLCGGGCHYEAAARHGTLEKPDPIRCELNRAIIVESIEIAAQLGRLPVERLRKLLTRDENTIVH